MPLSPGDLLATKYRIEAEIGRGAFGRVYRARDVELDRVIAIKELHRGEDDLGSTQFSDYVRRFEREARVQAGFNHPNIVHVYELVREEADRLYLVMEYVDGESLLNYLARHGSLPIDEAVRITAEILAGLNAVHADPRDIVHRDIKPSNVLLTKDGHAKLTDFGVAQEGALTRRTQIGGPHPGTALYMSPEQAATSGLLYPTSDIYSVGCVLFELLTSQAYQSSKRAGKDLRALRPDTPGWLIDVTERALAREPENRLDSAATMEKLLREAKSPPEKPEVLEARRQAEKVKAEEAERARLIAELHARAENDRKQMAALQQRIEAEKTERARREAELAKQQAEIVRKRQREEAERQRRQTAERRRLMAGAGIVGMLLIVTLSLWQPWRDRTARGPSTPAGTTSPAATAIVVAQVTKSLATDSRTSRSTPAAAGLSATNAAATTASPTAKSTPTPSATPAPTDTPSPSSTPTAIPTATPTRTKSPTPRPSPAINGTPVPLPEAVIMPENAAQIEELARWNVFAKRTQVAYSPDGRLLAVVNDKTVTCYDPMNLTKIHAITIDDPIASVAFSPDGKILVMAAGKSVRVWHLGEATARRMQTEQPGIRNVVVSQDGQSVIGLADKIYSWSIDDGSLQSAFGEAGTSLALSPDGKYLALSATWGVSLWRTADNMLAHRLEGSGGYSESKTIAFAPNGLLIMAILAGSGNGYVYGGFIWRVDDGSLVQGPISFGGGGWSSSTFRLAFSPDSQTVGVVQDIPTGYYADKHACQLGLWRVSDGVTLRTWDNICTDDVMFSPNGRTLLTVGGDLRFWGIPTGQ